MIVLHESSAGTDRTRDYDPAVIGRVQELLGRQQRVVIELGCGPNKVPGRIGIDRLPLPGVDIVADLEQGLQFLPDSSVDEIHSESFVEHVEDFEGLMREIVRVLKPGGTKRLFVPHFSNPYYYSDYTHRRFFGLYTFYYFSADQSALKHRVPSFYTEIRVKILSQRLRFFSPHRPLHLLKKLIEKIVNHSTRTQEFYEENFSSLIPCYGMDVIFTPSKGGDEHKS